MFFLISKLAEAICTPFAISCLLIAVSCAALWRRWLRISLACNVVALAILVVLGNSFVERALLLPLEMSDLPPHPIPAADAIVVLGGITKPAFPPQPMIHLAGSGDRLLYAAKLYREGKAPVVVASGGRLPWDSNLPPESAQMAELLEMMGVPASAILQEPASRTTHENAAFVKPMLAAHHLRRVLLVTSASAMPRALDAFRHEMIDAIPAPTDFTTSELALTQRDLPSRLQKIALSIWPNAGSMEETTRALHEYFGLIAYRLTGWI